jgi:hypothetical protein
MNRRVRLNARLGLGPRYVELPTPPWLACHETARRWPEEARRRSGTYGTAGSFGKNHETVRDRRPPKPCLTEATAAMHHCRADPKGCCRHEHR